MPITIRLAARVNTEESNRYGMGDCEEQENTCSTTSDDNFDELLAMTRHQMELMFEHTAVKTTLNDIRVSK